jgi:hypothetical protein
MGIIDTLVMSYRGEHRKKMNRKKNGRHFILFYLEN